MFLSLRWRKVIRDLWANKSRTFLVILSIAIGVFAFGGLFIAQIVGLSDMNSQYLETNPANIIFSLSPFDDELVRWAARQPYVTGAQGRAVQSLRLLVGDKVHNVTLYAYDDFANLHLDCIYPETGAWPPGKDELLLERSFVPVVAAEIGDTVTVELVDGRLHELTFAGTVHDVSVMPGSIQSQVTAYTSLNTLYRMGFPARYTQLEFVLDKQVAYAGKSGSVTNPTEVADQLQRELRHLGIRVQSVRVREADEGHWAAEIVSGMGTVLVFVGFASLLLSGFLVVNTISGLMARQKRQIGIMKIIGASRQQIMGVYFVMVASFGAIALVIAIPASLGLAYVLLNSIGVEFLNFNFPNFYFPLQILLLQIAVGLLSPLAAALVPILNGTRIPAAEAITDHTVQSHNHWLDVWLAQIRGLSRPLLMAVRNTFRRKARLLMTLITLTLAGALFISIMNVRHALMSEVNEMLRMSDFDVQLILDNRYRTDGVTRRAEQVPGVMYAEGWAVSSARRIRADNVRGETFTVYGMPYDSPFVSPPMEQGRWLESDDEYVIVFNDELLKDEPDIQVGDEITLEFNGDQHDWRVVGVLTGSFQPAAYAPYDYFSRFIHTPNQTSTLLIRTTSDDGTFQKRIADDLEAYLDLRDIGLARSVTKTTIIDGITGGFEVLIIVLMGMSVLVAVVGGLGLAGTMSLNVMERTREVGVMRAVGATTSTVRRIFIIEGVIIGFLSWIAAMPLAISGTNLFGVILGQVVFERPLPYRYESDGVLIWLMIVILISISASLMPAQRASEISVQEALAYE